jgi:hypothetical protein
LGAAGVILAVIAMTKLDFKIMKSKEIRLKWHLAIL